MCLSTSGLCTWTTSRRRLINLTTSVEVKGNVCVPRPSLFWTTIVFRALIFIFYAVVLSVIFAEGHLSEKWFTKWMSMITMMSYCLYFVLSVVTAFIPSNVVYECSSIVLQWTAATAFQGRLLRHCGLSSILVSYVSLCR